MLKDQLMYSKEIKDLKEQLLEISAAQEEVDSFINEGNPNTEIKNLTAKTKSSED